MSPSGGPSSYLGLLLDPFFHTRRGQFHLAAFLSPQGLKTGLVIPSFPHSHTYFDNIVLTAVSVSQLHRP